MRTLPILMFLSCVAPDSSDVVQSSAEFLKKPIRVADYPLSPLLDGAGRFWFGSVGSGVGQVEKGKLRYLHADDGLMGDRNMGFLEGKDGAIWFTTAENEMGGRCAVVRIRGEAWEQFSLGDAGNEGAGGVLESPEGEIWVTATAGVFRFNGASFEPHPLPDADANVMEWTPHSGLITREGTRIWATSDRGVYIDRGEEVFERLTVADGLLTNNVQVLFEDLAGQIWFSCHSWHDSQAMGGLCVWDGRDIRTFPEIRGLYDNDIYSGTQTRDGAIWIGATGLGVYRYLDGDWELFNAFGSKVGAMTPENFGMNDIVEDASGKLWFCFAGGLFVLRDGKFHHVSQADLPTEIERS